MRDVDLLDTDDAPADPPVQASEPSFLERVRRHPRWLAAGATVIVALVGFQVVSDRRVRAEDDARAAALADVPLILDPVDRSFPVFLHGTYSWEDDVVPPVVSAYLGAGAIVQGVVVTGSQGVSTGDPSIAGLDPATGELLWQTVVDAPADGAVGRGAWCWATEPAEATTTHCTVYWELPAQEAADLGSFGPLYQMTSLVEVDASSGAVRRRTDVPRGATLATGPDGPIVGTVDGSHLTLDATAWDGTHLWTQGLDLPPSDDPSYLSIVAAGDRVLVRSGPGGDGWLLDAGDGAVVVPLSGDPDAPYFGPGDLLPSGVVVTADPAFPFDQSSGDQPARLVLRDGTEVSLDGDHVDRVAIDDGTLGDALLTGVPAERVVTRARAGESTPATPQESGVARLREADGSVRWQVPGLDISTAIAVDGLVIARTATEVVAIDAASGGVRWRTAAPDDGDAYTRELLTDGRVILVSRGAQLDALSFRGERLWSVHLAAGADGHVIEAGAAPTPAPTEGQYTVVGDRVTWIASLSGRLGLVISGSDGSQDEYFVFDPARPRSD